MVRCLLWTVALAACLFTLGARLAPAAALGPQAKARLTAHLSSGVVKMGASTSLVIGVEDAAQASIAQLPKVENLQFGPLGRPQERKQFSTINGRVYSSSQYAWVVSVTPLAEGEYTIPPFEVVMDGQVARTSQLKLKVVADLRGEELGSFELRPSSRKLVEGQPFSLELRFGYDEGLASKINIRNLILSWWGELPGVLELETQSQVAQNSREVAFLNLEERLEVEQLPTEDVRGRRFLMFRLQRNYVATRAGKLEIPTSFFEFARAVRSNDIFSSGTLEKVESYFVRAQPLVLEILSLPEKGRPIDFGGAIGQLSARADAQPRDVDQGDSIRFEVEWTGTGNLDFFSPPDPSRLDAFAGFRLYGSTETKQPGVRKVVYDLAPLDSNLREIPPLPMGVFDPDAEAYVTVTTQPIPIRVRALEGATGLASSEAARFESDLEDIVSISRPHSPTRAPGPGWIALAFATIPVCYLALRGVARRRADPNHPLERRRRRAPKELARALQSAADARARLDGLHEFLGARTREPAQLWVGRSAKAWAASAEQRRGGLEPMPRLSSERAGQLDMAVEALERAAYAASHVCAAGAVQAGSQAELAELAKTLVREGF